MKQYLTKGKIAVIAIILVIVGVFSVGYKTHKETDTSKPYLIEKENYIDYQENFECSGYASAYVLRSLGIEADGKDIYSKIENKEPDGGVSPFTLVDYLNDNGYVAEMHEGTEEDLKNEVAKGVPVIAFVKAAPSRGELHYLPIVGYDEENFYAADSLGYFVNAYEEVYNRKISNEDFQEMWDVSIGDGKVYNIYITIGLKE